MHVLHLSFVDWLLVAVYFLTLLALGLRGTLRGAPASQSAEEYLLSGRKLTLPAFVAALVSTWYGGILGVGEYSYLYGLSNWFVFGVPYYVFALIFALFLAKKVRESMAYSIPDQLASSFGRRVGITGSLFVFFMSSPAPYVLMQAVLLQVVTGWPLPLCLLLGTAASVLYMEVGGFRALVRIDLLQFGLMFAGFIVLLAFLIPVYGVMPFIPEHVTPSHLTPTGGNSWQYVVVWFFIALWTLVAPQFHQFTLSAESPRTARRGILLSIVFWTVFDGLTTLSGLYARALLPGLAQPTMAFPALGELVLPAAAKGLFFLGMVATVMSTTDGLTFIAASTFGRDLLAPMSRRRSDRDVMAFTRAGVLITAAVAIGGALLFPSVIRLWYVIGTLFIPGLLLPVLSSYSARYRVSPAWTLAMMLAGFFFSLLWFLWGIAHAAGDAAQYPFGIEPMYAGLAASALCFLAGAATPSSRYSSPGRVHRAP
jgi:solute:Na+ symporter, SSS family